MSDWKADLESRVLAATPSRATRTIELVLLVDASSSMCGPRTRMLDDAVAAVLVDVRTLALEAQPWWRRAVRLGLPIGEEVDHDVLRRFVGRRSVGASVS